MTTDLELVLIIKIIVVLTFRATEAAPSSTQAPQEGGRALCEENGKITGQGKGCVNVNHPEDFWPNDKSYFDIHGAMKSLPNCDVMKEWCWAADYERPRILDFLKEISKRFPPEKLLKYYYRVKMRGTKHMDGFYLYVKYQTAKGENKNTGIIHGILYFPWFSTGKDFPFGYSFVKWGWAEEPRDEKNERPWP